MPNDDRLERLIASPETLREYIPSLQAEAERAKQLQEKITAMEHGMKFYIDRTTKLIDKAESLERTIECWVTQAGLLEAKLREKESELSDDAAMKADLAHEIELYEAALHQKDADNRELLDKNQRLQRECSIRANLLSQATDRSWRKDELLWWITALAYQHVSLVFEEPFTFLTGDDLRQMLTTQGYTREALEKH